MIVTIVLLARVEYAGTFPDQEIEPAPCTESSYIVDPPEFWYPRISNQWKISLFVGCPTR
jgi:hypothetical protein